MSPETTFPTYRDPTSSSNEFNSLSFFFDMMMRKVAVATLVQVVAVSNAGSVSPVGTVDIHPLVNQVDGTGAPTPHGTIYGVPYSRLQGGANAVILDPQVGDIGVAVFAHGDVSSVKTNKAQANPGSWRRNDMTDALYIGGMLNGTPSQYVQFSTAGVTVVSPLTVTIQAPTVVMDSSTSVTINSPEIVLNGQLTQGLGTYGGTATMLGPLIVTNDVIATTTSVHTHVHSGVQSGSSDTGPPV